MERWRVHPARDAVFRRGGRGGALAAGGHPRRGRARPEAGHRGAALRGEQVGQRGYFGQPARPGAAVAGRRAVHGRRADARLRRDRPVGGGHGGGPGRDRARGERARLRAGRRRRGGPGLRSGRRRGGDAAFRLPRCAGRGFPAGGGGRDRSARRGDRSVGGADRARPVRPTRRPDHGLGPGLDRLPAAGQRSGRPAPRLAGARRGVGARRGLHRAGAAPGRARRHRARVHPGHLRRPGAGWPRPADPGRVDSLGR